MYDAAVPAHRRKSIGVLRHVLACEIPKLLRIGAKTRAVKRNCAYGGGSGIRTHDTVARIHAFQACAFSHSAIPPGTGNAAI